MPLQYDNGLFVKMGLLADIVKPENLLRAFHRVKENRGCAGVDGVTIKEFEIHLSRNLGELRNELLKETYVPLPLLKILVDKGNGESRPLLIPCVKDRVVQSSVLEIIEPIFEAEFEQCSYAYRKGRSMKQAICQVKEYREKGFHWVVDADIDAYFDNIDHQLLFEKVRKVINDASILKLIEGWIKGDVWDGEKITQLSKGIPQGAVISPLLANLFLDQLDEELMEQGFKLVRFADDFLILCKTPQKAQEALKAVDLVLEKLSLELDESDIISFEQGFKYLGVYFIRSLIFVPYDRPKRKRKVNYFPPPMDLSSYLAKRKGAV